MYDHACVHKAHTLQSCDCSVRVFLSWLCLWVSLFCQAHVKLTAFPVEHASNSLCFLMMWEDYYPKCLDMQTQWTMGFSDQNFNVPELHRWLLCTSPICKTISCWSASQFCACGMYCLDCDTQKCHILLSVISSLNTCWAWNITFFCLGKKTRTKKLYLKSGEVHEFRSLHKDMSKKCWYVYKKRMDRC